MKFGILLCCLSMQFFKFSLVFFNCIEHAPNDVSQNVGVVLLVPYGVLQNLNAILVSVRCYAKPQCYYSCFEITFVLTGLYRVSTRSKTDSWLSES